MPKLPKYKIVGMQYHHYGSDLENLFLSVVGKRVLLKPQDDNKQDPEQAVIASMLGHALGYVSKSCRKKVRKLFSAEHPILRGKVTRVIRKKNDDESDMLEFEVTDIPETEVVATDFATEPSEDFSSWEWQGERISQSNIAAELWLYLTDLRLMLQDHEPWNEDMEVAMDTIHRTAWIDMSREAWLAYADIMRMLTERAEEDERFEEMADRLDQVLSHVNSDESVKRLCKYLEDTSKSEEVDEMLKGVDIATFEEQIPAPLKPLLQLTPEDLVSRISYLQMPRTVLMGLYTIVCLNNRLITATLSDENLPIEERVIKVKSLLLLAKIMPFEQKCTLLLTIMMNCPNLSEKDNMVLSKTFSDITPTSINEYILGNKNVASGGQQTNLDLNNMKQLLKLLPSLQSNE